MSQKLKIQWSDDIFTCPLNHYGMFNIFISYHNHFVVIWISRMRSCFVGCRLFLELCCLDKIKVDVCCISNTVQDFLEGVEWGQLHLQGWLFRQHEPLIDLWQGMTGKTLSLIRAEFHSAAKIAFFFAACTSPHKRLSHLSWQQTARWLVAMRCSGRVGCWKVENVHF